MQCPGCLAFSAGRLAVNLDLSRRQVADLLDFLLPEVVTIFDHNLFDAQRSEQPLPPTIFDFQPITWRGLSMVT
jgi:hypothetical protein